MASAFDSLSDLRETIAGTPAPTSSFRKAVRRALAAMDDLLGEIRGQKLTLDQVLASLDSSIERKQGAP
jgi:hypothetical protein